MKTAVVVDCCRTPIGRAHAEKGVFRDVRSDDLAVAVVRALVERTRIDPAAIQVQLARTRSSYKRIIDRVLSPARLYSQIRVDESGTPFLWITR